MACNDEECSDAAKTLDNNVSIVAIKLRKSSECDLDPLDISLIPRLHVGDVIPHPTDLRDGGERKRPIPRGENVADEDT